MADDDAPKLAPQSESTAVHVMEDSLLAPVPEDRQLFLEFQGLKGWVSTLIGTPGLLSSLKALKKDTGTPEFRQIIHGISGSCKPGQVLALMGPSGSGKTSVLSILGGRTPKSVELKGSVLFNGEKLTKRVKKRIGYVLQDEIMYETLTTYETLHFAAMLRLPKTMTAAEKEERVETVIKTLGLTRCRNTIIGGPLRRGVSGGERKRVSIGHELLINPAAIFLDEPTSGLDSTAAMHLLKTLRQLASGGRMVVTTIHQPSSRLYMQLDKLLLLSHGHTIYYGDADRAVDWFEKLGYTLPRGVNQAEHLLDIASGDVSTYKISGEDGREHCIACAEQFLQSHPHGYGPGNDVSDVGFELWNRAKSQNKLVAGTIDSSSSSCSTLTSLDEERPAPRLDICQPPRPDANNAATEPSGAPWVTQYLTLLRRALKVRRFEALSLQDILHNTTVAVLAGMFWFRTGQTNTVYGASNANGLVFFLTMFNSMRAILSSIFVFPPELKMVLKERASGMYQISSYYFARTSSDLPIDCTMPSVVVIIMYFMGGLRCTADAFFATLFAVLLLALVSHSLGLFVGAVVRNAKTAQTITLVTGITMTLVAGFFTAKLPVWIDWLKYLSFIYYSFSLLQKIQYSDRAMWDCMLSTVKNVNPANPGNCTYLPSGASVQKALYMSRNPDEVPWEAAALVIYFLFMRTLIYLALRWRTRSTVR